MICSSMVLKIILFFGFFFYVTVLCVSVARIRDGGRVIALSAEIMSFEAGAFFFFFLAHHLLKGG